jgi:hypothetical protein
MIKLKPLIVPRQSPSIDEASEELYDIRKQPQDTCPLIDNIQSEAKQLFKKMYNYEKMDIEDLHDILWRVDNFLHDNLIGGSQCAIERVRENVSEIRAWGGEWKEYAKRVDPKIPLHQQPQNLPKWGSLT